MPIYQPERDCSIHTVCPFATMVCLMIFDEPRLLRTKRRCVLITQHYFPLEHGKPASAAGIGCPPVCPKPSISFAHRAMFFQREPGVLFLHPPTRTNQSSFLLVRISENLTHWAPSTRVVIFNATLNSLRYAAV